MWHVELPTAPVPGCVIRVTVELELDQYTLNKVVRAIEYQCYGAVMNDIHHMSMDYPEIANVNSMPGCVVYAHVSDAVFSDELGRYTLPPLA